MSGSEDDAWRQIVDHYGERPAFPDHPRDTERAPRPEDDRQQPRPPDELDEQADPGARFVPPDPPLPPRPRGARLAAWVGVLGSPALLLALALAGITLKSTFSTLLVMWFLGGFLYLVWQMPHDPGDPSDDGARL